MSYTQSKINRFNPDREYIYWESRDGRSIEIRDFDDDHLANTIVYLVKRIDEWARACEVAKVRSNVDLGLLIINNREATEWFDILIEEVRRRQNS